jgi:hypothetical protein
MSKVRWGILSTAKIAVTKVIPGMQKGVWSEVTAIASRDRGKAEDAARTLGIPKSCGSYEELLADLEIEAIYNPLPSGLPVTRHPWCSATLSQSRGSPRPENGVHHARQQYGCLSRSILRMKALH